MKQGFVVLLLLLLVLFNIYMSRPPKGVDTVDSDRLRRLAEEGGVVIDVRQPDEFKGGHIPGSKNLPLGSKDFFNRLPKDKQKPLIIYCRSGKRAVKAERDLLKRGYENVYHFGSIGKWTGDLEY